MRTIILAIVLITSGQVLSQSLISDIIDPNFRNRDLLFKYGDYNGTPYLLEKWKRVKIHTTLNGVLEQEKANFDIYDQKLIIRTDEKEIVVNDHQILHFNLETDTGAEKKFVKQSVNNKISYYEVIHEGKLNIFKAYSKKFERPNENVDHNYGGEVSEKPYFSRTKLTYYMNFDGSELIRTTLTKKSIQKILPSKFQRKYKQLLKKEKVSFKREEELKAFLQKLETEFKE